ncbi:MAG: hypothetical protein D6E12_05775 [Desulfovibrio sp.]|nr:MAG: hypothetical protein D6E12_05775 [Desulfovibrio sp.]
MGNGVFQASIRLAAAVLALGSLLVLANACSTLSVVEDSLFSQERVISLEHDGTMRSAVLVFPDGYTDMRRMPVVIDLHGFQENAASEMAMSGMAEAAMELGFLAVFPEGMGGGWNVGPCCGGASQDNVNDLGFLAELIDLLIVEYGADPQRVYVTGFGNGGALALTAGCRLSHKVAGVGAVGASMELTNCRPVKPMPVILFHGDGDAVVPYTGGQSDLLDMEIPSVADVVAYWVARNGGYEAPERIERDGVLRERYVGQDAGSEVMVYTILGGGHSWPGGRASAVNPDEPSTALSAAWTMLEFFSRQPSQ